jgi:hypothetical protein
LFGFAGSTYLSDLLLVLVRFIYFFRNGIGMLLRWLVEGCVKGFVCLTLLFAVCFIFIPTFAATEFVANMYCSLPFGLRCWFLGATLQLNCFVALFF